MSFQSIITTVLLFSATIAYSAVVVPPAGSANKAGEYGYSWTVCDNCSEPESAYYDTDTKVLFVSNVAGEATKKDGKGWIQKVGTNGKVLKSKWTTGLNAPKGLRSHKGALWVSDIDQIVSIKISTGKVIKKYDVKGAKFLNDVAVDSDGTVYVSDMLDNKIYQLKNGVVSVFIEGVELDAPNGLLIESGHLIVASWGIPSPDFSTKVPGRLWKISLDSKKITAITEKPIGNLDGLEVDGNGNYLVTDWMAGKVMRISKDGKVTDLFTGMKGAADIGYIAEQQLLVIPRMNENQITAYDMKSYPK